MDKAVACPNPINSKSRFLWGIQLQAGQEFTVDVGSDGLVIEGGGALSLVLHGSGQFFRVLWQSGFYPAP